MNTHVCNTRALEISYQEVLRMRQITQITAETQISKYSSIWFTET